MANCKHYGICGLPDDADPEDHLCILHTDKHKDSWEFSVRLDAHIQERGYQFGEMHFPGYDGFRGHVFGAAADFHHATFSTDISFEGAVFRAAATFKYTRFTGRANFTDCRFEQGVDFESTFLKTASFIRTSFSGSSTFAYSKFTEYADFRSASFTGRASFTFAQFFLRSAEVGFDRGVFDDEDWDPVHECDFEDSTFANVSFSSCKFGGRAKFDGAEFQSEAAFDSAVFESKAWFRGARFAGESSFSHVTHEGEAVFLGARFCNLVSFRGTKFWGAKHVVFLPIFARDSKADHDAIPPHSPLREATVFSRAVFEKKADFQDAVFSGDAFFREASFQQGADFKDAFFSGERVDFQDAHVLGTVRFASAQPTETSSRAFYEVREVSFAGVEINPPDALSFLNADLRRCRFGVTTVREVQFSNVEWPRVRQRFRSARTAVYDDPRIEKGADQPPLEHVERLYRQLRQNYESHNEFDRAADFRYGELEMRRRNPSTRAGASLLLLLYWIVGGVYGEKFLRPLIWAVCLVILSAVGYVHWGVADGVHLDWRNVGDWLVSLRFSGQTMFFPKPSFVELEGSGDTIFYFQGILGPALLALFLNAVRQRLSR